MLSAFSTDTIHSIFHSLIGRSGWIYSGRRSGTSSDSGNLRRSVLSIDEKRIYRRLEKILIFIHSKSQFSRRRNICGNTRNTLAHRKCIHIIGRKCLIISIIYKILYSLIGRSKNIIRSTYSVFCVAIETGQIRRKRTRYACKLQTRKDRKDTTGLRRRIAI